MEKRGVDCRRKTIQTVRIMRGRTRQWAINKVENTLTKKIWLHLHSPIKIVGGRKFQWDHLMSVGQCNNIRSRCPHDVKRNDKNMGERVMVLLCRLGLLLLVGEGTSGSIFWVAGWAAPPFWWGGVGGSSNRVHLGEGERRPTARREMRRRVLTTEDSNTKLRIIERLNLLVSQPFLYICVGQYTIVMVRLQHKSITTIFFI